MSSDHQCSLLLASRSPRRVELLQQIGVDFRMCAVDIDEQRRREESPEKFVLRLARAKAGAAQCEADHMAVLGADTIVTLGGNVFGKPRDLNHALSMWSKLSGATHEVYTAVALCHGGSTDVVLSKSKVTFRTISLAEQEAYWRSNEPCDKAGGYAIQGLGAVFITRLEGSYSGVMGLPLCETASLLAHIGISPVLGRL